MATSTAEDDHTAQGEHGQRCRLGRHWAADLQARDCTVRRPLLWLPPHAFAGMLNGICIVYEARLVDNSTKLWIPQ